MPTDLDYAAALVVVLAAASVITAITVIWKPIRKVTNFTDLITRELTGWRDITTGEEHPSLRAEIHQISNRLDEFIARVSEDIADLHRRVARLESEVGFLKRVHIEQEKDSE